MITIYVTLWWFPNIEYFEAKQLFPIKYDKYSITGRPDLL